RAPLERTEAELEQLRSRRAAPDLSPEEIARLDREIADLESALPAMELVASGRWDRLADLQKQQEARRDAAEPEQPAREGWAGLEQRLNRGLEQANDNPSLLLYKLKTNGYKFSWALIPLSIPFLWLMFFWRRDIRLYDHAVFTTYS